MSKIDLRKGLNAVSDVVANRPLPIRDFDQIHMKHADMLLHVEHISRHFEQKTAVFVGDGDAIGLSCMHLLKAKIIDKGPSRVHVLDFDERVVNSINRFALNHGLNKKITASLYNVADPLPDKFAAKFDAFHINPPFGQKNGGLSIKWFLRRALQATSNKAVGCVVMADDDNHAWTISVLQEVQKELITCGCAIREILPSFHNYHLDDSPDLRSCSMTISKCLPQLTPANVVIPPNDRLNFYGKGGHLKVKFVRASDSIDHKFENYE